MGRKHPGILMEMFPDQKGTGVDYGNVEFKESKNGDRSYDIYPKDERAEYILFLDYFDFSFRLCDLQDLPEIKFHRKIRTEQIERICIWTKTDVNEINKIINKIKKEFDEKNERKKK